MVRGGKRPQQQTAGSSSRRDPPATGAKRPSRLARENGVSAAEERDISEAFRLFATRDESFAGGGEDVMLVGDVRRALMCVVLYARAQRVLFLNLFSYQSFILSLYFHSQCIPSALWPGACGIDGVPERVVKRQLANESEMLTFASPQPHRALSLPPSSPSELRSITTSIDPTGTGFVDYPSFLAVCALKLRARTPKAVEEAIDAAFRLFTSGDDEGPITLAHLRRVARELKEDVSEDVLRDMILEANGGSSVGRGVNKEEFEGVMRRAGAF